MYVSWRAIVRKYFHITEDIPYFSGSQKVNHFLQLWLAVEMWYFYVVGY